MLRLRQVSPNGPKDNLVAHPKEQATIGVSLSLHLPLTPIAFIQRAITYAVSEMENPSI